MSATALTALSEMDGVIKIMVRQHKKESALRAVRCNWRSAYPNHNPNPNPNPRMFNLIDCSRTIGAWRHATALHRIVATCAIMERSAIYAEQKRRADKAEKDAEAMKIQIQEEHQELVQAQEKAITCKQATQRAGKAEEALTKLTAQMKGDREELDNVRSKLAIQLQANAELSEKCTIQVEELSKLKRQIDEEHGNP